MSTNVQINASVTPYEGDQPGPRDWAGYVSGRLRELVQDAEISVSYGPSNSVYVYGDDALEDELCDTFTDLLSQWWNELCSDSEQWVDL